MKKLQTIIVAFTVLVSTSIVAQNKMANNIDNSNIALQGYSPVSYLDLQLAQRGNKNFKSTYNKVAYYFTSAKQKKVFDKNPTKYMPQYGGFCAFGIYAGAKFRTDPNKFIVKNNQYFLYLNNVELDAKQLWLAEKKHTKLKNIADKNWSKLHKTHN